MNTSEGLDLTPYVIGLSEADQGILRTLAGVANILDPVELQEHLDAATSKPNETADRLRATGGLSALQAAQTAVKSNIALRLVQPGVLTTKAETELSKNNEYRARRLGYFTNPGDHDVFRFYGSSLVVCLARLAAGKSIQTEVKRYYSPTDFRLHPAGERSYPSD